MSVGKLTFDLVKEAIKKAGNDWDVEILEMHHNNKIDSPSGTAISIGKSQHKQWVKTLNLFLIFKRRLCWEKKEK